MKMPASACLSSPPRMWVYVPLPIIAANFMKAFTRFVPEAMVDGGLAALNAAFQSSSDVRALVEDHARTLTCPLSPYPSRVWLGFDAQLCAFSSLLHITAAFLWMASWNVLIFHRVQRPFRLWTNEGW